MYAIGHGPGELWLPLGNATSVVPLPPPESSADFDADSPAVRFDLGGPPWYARPWGKELGISAATCHYAVATCQTVKVFGSSGDEVMHVGLGVTDTIGWPQPEEDESCPTWLDVPASFAYDADSGCLLVSAPPDDGVRRIDRHFRVLEELSPGYAPTCICVANGLLFTSYTSEEPPDANDCVCSVSLSNAITKLVLKRVQRWRSFGNAGPAGMAADSTTLVASDSTKSRVGVWSIHKAAKVGDLRVTFVQWLGKAHKKTTTRLGPGPRSQRPIKRAPESAPPGEFRQPTGVALMRDLLFVAESAGQRVQVLTKSGEPLQVVPMPGPCTALCVDAFHVAVCEGGNMADNGETHRVHLLKLKQEPTATTTSS